MYDSIGIGHRTCDS